jgi:hypothetical protein
MNLGHSRNMRNEIALFGFYKASLNMQTRHKGLYIAKLVAHVAHSLDNNNKEY